MYRFVKNQGSGHLKLVNFVVFKFPLTRQVFSKETNKNISLVLSLDALVVEISASRDRLIGEQQTQARKNRNPEEKTTFTRELY